MYLDSCILVKLITPEPDSAQLMKMVSGELITTSFLTYAEVHAAILRKWYKKDITEEQFRRGWKEFQRMEAEEILSFVPLNDTIVKRATRLMDKCYPAVPIRTLDALQLATCDQIQDWPLVTTDDRMRQAANLLNFPVAP